MASQGTAGSKNTDDNSNKIGIPPIVIFSVCLAASAGFTMYTKRASSMLRTMEKVTERQKLRNPPRIGPPTKEEWEKMRPRWTDDDI
ncbi:expressed unknown protein [Seminavis robusta]|uniref:Transmembrane protein n=1 Tax=Seminavis robusta TaxID=568900 RepID=A0A9N8E5X5_9STRA|nr:expressed unknown protein [Seminavis robusta]|eukprot:Sro654_g182040.1 n/a (87) ;mRNA; r:19746-20006